MSRFLAMLKNAKRDKSEPTEPTEPTEPPEPPEPPEFSTSTSDSFVSETKGLNQNLENEIDADIERDVLQALINCGYCGTRAAEVARAIAKGNRDANSLEVMLMQS